MPEAAKKDVQLPWNCRWLRSADQFIGIPEQERLDRPWVCVRPRRGRLTVDCTPPPVTEDECAVCPFWEPDYDPDLS